MRGMNKLPLEKRAQILNLLVEGSSLRSISRVAGVSINTVTKLLVDAGRACAVFHDLNVRKVEAKKIQRDEIWSFCYAKARNVADAKAAPDDAGNVWTFTALDADTKLMVSWMVGDRDGTTAYQPMSDLKADHGSDSAYQGWFPGLCGCCWRGVRRRSRLCDAGQDLRAA
jgi:lambda repressor-like predicted transcriptional regulator